VAVALPAELEVATIESVLGMAIEHAGIRLLPPERHDWARETLHEACQLVAVTGSPFSAEPGSGRQLAAARGFITTAGPAHVALLSAWLSGESVPSGLTLDSDLRWAVLARLATLGAVGQAEIDAERALDGSERGEQEAVRCRASLPDPAAKAWAFDLVVTEQGLSNRVVSAAGDGFWRPEHAVLTDSYVERFFVELPRSAGRSGDVLKAIAAAAYPRYAVARSTVEHAERALAGTLHPLLRRALVDLTDDLRRALRARSRG
jgi:aminopeptidase N